MAFILVYLDINGGVTDRGEEECHWIKKGLL